MGGPRQNESARDKSLLVNKSACQQERELVSGDEHKDITTKKKDENKKD